MDNYIVINGKKAELTEEQLEKLGIKVENKNPFERVELGNRYWYIGNFNNTIGSNDARYNFDDRLYNSINYFNNESFANQVALHEQLNLKLLKFAYDHKATVNWEDENPKYYIAYRFRTKEFSVGLTIYDKSFDVCFSSHFVATKAINKVVKPFMAEHPNFVW